MRRVLLLLTLFTGIISCKNSGSVPGDVLPQPKMQAVMWDMMRADQFLSDYVLNKDSSKNKELESIKLYTRIFAFHKISKEEFEKSFAYYRSNPLQLQELMDSVSKQKLGTALTPLAENDSVLKPSPGTQIPNIDSIKKVMAPQAFTKEKKDSAVRQQKKIRRVSGN
jgi:hypothetical protein